MRNLDGLSLAVLRHCRGEPRALVRLLKSHATSSIYRRKRSLMKRGLLERCGGHLYQTTAAGSMEIECADGNSSAEPPGLDRHIPQLRWLPTRAHVSVIELVLAAVVARKYGLATSHLLGFMFTGERLSWKTTTATAGVSLAGGDPRTAVAFTPSETRRSLSVRRTSTGDEATRRGLLEAPVAVFDELARASSEVKREVQLFMHGTASIPYENGTLEIKAVPIATMNPVRETGDLSERLGLDAAQLRRAVVIDFGALPVPDDVLASGDEILEAMAKEGPAQFTEPKHPRLNAKAQIQRMLLSVLKEKELFALIDLKGLEVLAAAMTAWLPPEQALQRTVFDYCVAIGTLGWVRDDWREVLFGRSDSREEGNVGNAQAAESGREARSSLDYDGRLHELSTACHAAGLTPAEMAAAIQRYRKAENDGTLPLAEALLNEVKDRKLDGERAAGVLCDSLEHQITLATGEKKLLARVTELKTEISALTKRRATLAAAVKELGWSEERLASLALAEAALRKAGVDATSAAAAVRAAGDLAKSLELSVAGALGEMPRLVEFLGRELLARLPERAGDARALPLIAAEAAQNLRLATAIERRTRQLGRLNAEIGAREQESRRDEERRAEAESRLDAVTVLMRELGDEVQLRRRSLAQLRTAIRKASRTLRTLMQRRAAEEQCLQSAAERQQEA